MKINPHRTNAHTKYINIYCTYSMCIWMALLFKSNYAALKLIHLLRALSLASSVHNIFYEYKANTPNKKMSTKTFARASVWMPLAHIPSWSSLCIYSHVVVMVLYNCMTAPCHRVPLSAHHSSFPQSIRHRAHSWLTIAGFFSCSYNNI